MRLLELFAGSRSVGKVAESLGWQVFSLDIQPFDGIDLVADILTVSAKDIPWVPDMIWASPPCTTFSVASMGHHWKAGRQPKTPEAIIGIRIVEKTLAIIDHFVRVNPGLKFFIENPRGMLRRLPVIGSLPRETVTYCSYGDQRMKPTDIWTNHAASMFNPDGWKPRPMCSNDNDKCDHERAPRGSKTGTQGLSGAYERAIVPTELASEVMMSVKEKPSEQVLFEGVVAGGRHFGNMHGGQDAKDEWLTPPHILAHLGQFDLDPCAPINRPWATATNHYTIEDSGLMQPWAGRVWMNPPYGNQTEKWMQRLAEHGNGIALIFARTETNSFFPWVWDYAAGLFFFKRRLAFYHADGTEADSAAGAPSVLVAYGSDNAEVLSRIPLQGKFVDLQNRMEKAA